MYGDKRQQRTYKKRLLKLAAFLRALPRKRFFYGSWVGRDWGGAQDLSCGTTACALGWTPTIPAFRRLGVRLIRMGGKSFVGMRDMSRSEDMTPPTVAGPVRAGRVLFGLDETEFSYLFYPRGHRLGNPFDDLIHEAPGVYATPRVVAKHIERFVNYLDRNP